MVANSRVLMAARAALVISGAALVDRVLAGPVADLPGRWAGFGQIKMASGETEQMRCVATYFVDGAALKQNLRCASAGYKIDATANLKLTAGGQVSGDWEEKIWSTTGTVSGRMLDNGFNLTINGPGFSAALAMTTTNCKQTLSITPRGYEVSSISMDLGKC